MTVRTAHVIDKGVMQATCIRYRERTYSARIDGASVVVDGGEDGPVTLGAYCRAKGDGVRIVVTSGSQSYLNDRHPDASDRELAAAAIVSAALGHPDADAVRAGKALSAVWSHHLALVYGDEPRRIATIFAPTETKHIAWRIQDAAVVGVEIVDR